MKTIKLTALGLTGKEWIERLEKNEYKISLYAKDIMNSPEWERERMKQGEEVIVQLVTHKDYGKSLATTQDIKDYALANGMSLPKGELALLIREAVSDKQMEDMRIWYIASLHDPIRDSGGGPFVLRAGRDGGGRWVSTYWGDPSVRWGGEGAFAFPVSVSTSTSEPEHSSGTLNLEARVQAIEDALSYHNLGRKI